MTPAPHIDRQLIGRREPEAPPAGAAAASRGFSLAELVLALGVLAIGLTMAAALFPAAIKLNELSTYDSIGTIVATGGLAKARAFIRYPNDFDPNDPADPNFPDLQRVDVKCAARLLHPDLWLYGPDPTVPTTRGALVLGRPLVPTDPSGPYQLVIVAYDKYAPGSTVTADTVTISNPPGPSGGAEAVALSERPPVGSPLIIKNNGSYARITGYDPNNWAVLDHPIDLGPSLPVDAFVIHDNGAPGRNCVMMVLVAETVLY
jgi:prepilin-type N-terminal cleavage/methylation domain-containing protein